MPRKKSAPAIDMPSLREEFINQVNALLDQQEDTILDVLKRSENSKVGVGFHLTIDDSESAIKIATRIAFGEKYSDEKVSQLDVDQGKFGEVLESAKGSKGKGKTQAEEEDGE